MPTHASERKKAPLPEIPDKLYFRIGEVARLCDVPAYVLRFWETEFPQLRPNKSGTGQRLYRRREVELARRIRSLLYDEGYTIAGARQAFNAESRKAIRPPTAAAPPEAEVPAPAPSPQPKLPLSIQAHAEVPLEHFRAELKEILGILSTPVRRSAARRGNNAEESATSDLFD